LASGRVLTATLGTGVGVGVAEPPVGVGVGCEGVEPEPPPPPHEASVTARTLQNRKIAGRPDSVMASDLQQRRAVSYAIENPENAE
jgi:hypothetical protein